MSNMENTQNSLPGNGRDVYKKVDDIIREYETHTATDQTIHYKDLIDLKLNTPDNKKEILDILEKGLKDSTLVDLGAGGDGVRGMVRFAKLFKAKEYRGIDLQPYYEDFKEEIASVEGIDAQLITDNYLHALANMPAGDYNFVFFNPPYSNIDKELVDPNTPGSGYWKTFFQYIGELTPQGKVFLADSVSGRENLIKVIEGNGFKNVGQIKDDGHETPTVFVKL